ncbi:MAG TPA: amidase [Xanthobacteraceae bacterium]|nr:amidase [Xanthobacteraceae bacterium]
MTIDADAREEARHGGTFFVPHDLAAPIVGAAAGPLAGLTAAVKDMYDIAGERTGGGSPDWLAAQAPASTHAAAVAKLLDAGATIIGKTVCDEFFYSVTGANAHYGTPVNLRAPGRLPGGSSSGAAAATAAGACDFALGSDTGGSVRIPAALCGIYGLRPTLGRVDLSGAMAMAPSFDVAGWFAHGPGVLLQVGRVLLDEDWDETPPPIRGLLIADDAFAEADPAVVALLGRALAVAAEELPSPAHDNVAPDGLDAWRESFRIIQAREVWGIYGEFIERHRPNLGPGIRERMAFAATVTAQAAEAALKTQSVARERVSSLLPPGTVMALPTAPCIAPRIDTPAQALDSYRTRVMRLTCIAGLSGLPQVTIPIGTVDDCPVGLSFIAWAGGDGALLSLATRMAKYCGQLSE